MRERRVHARYVYFHLITVESGRSFGRGRIVNWSSQGLGLVCAFEVRPDRSHRVRFHLEKDQTLGVVAEQFTLEGSISWVANKEDGCHLGVTFDEPLRQVPLDRLKRFMGEDVFCYLYIEEQPEGAAA